LWEDAEAGKYEIWTSAYSYLEVIKGALGHGEVHHAEDDDEKVDRILAQPWVTAVQFDGEVAKLARSLRRKIRTDGEVVPRPDAIHSATAALYNCAEMHTWDGSHLLKHDQKILRDDGVPLTIRIPGPEVDGPLFAAGTDLMSHRCHIIQLLHCRADGRNG
jgi:predicted nucleic acid-binding protein